MTTFNSHRIFMPRRKEAVLVNWFAENKLKMDQSEVEKIKADFYFKVFKKPKVDTNYFYYTEVINEGIKEEK
jgi:hypothetical protein